LLALAGSVLLLAWWRTRQRAAELEHEAAQLQRRQQHAQMLNARLQTESDQLRRQAVQDTLTGALSRHAFAASLKDLLVHASHYGRPVALLVMDLDHFKSINDQYGHLSGDAALKLVVGITRENLGSGDLLGRFGGDEFLVAAIDHDPAAALALGEAIRKSVAQRAGATQALAKLRVSIGIAHATSTSGYDLEHLFQRADAALYAAKRSGRDRVAIESERDTAPTDQPSLRQLSSTAAEGEAVGHPVN
jgi:diguanylate cyclase (GGDEF)-like protein